MEPRPDDDQVLAQLLALVDEHGWAVRHVGAGERPGEAALSYTVGLTTLGHPEIVVVGMPFSPAQTFLNEAGAQVRAGRVFTHGEVDRTLAGVPVVFVAVVADGALTAVRQVYGDAPALQLVWSDSAGHLPWQPGYANPPGAQPLLGPLPDPLPNPGPDPGPNLGPNLGPDLGPADGSPA